MAESTLIYTALPAGLKRSGDGWFARLSVFVAPQLEVANGQDRLSAVPAMLDWPQVLNARRWRVVTATNTDTLVTTEPLFVATDLSPDSAAWQAIVPADTQVTSFSAARDNDTAVQIAGAVHYEAVPVVSAVRRVYAESLPSRTRRDTGASALQAFAGLSRRGVLQASSSPLGRFAAFLQPAEQRFVPPRQNSAETDEFHAILAGLGGHGPLLRKLGLVIDLDVPVNDLMLETASRIAVIADGDPLPGFVEHSVWTQIEVGAASTSDTRSFCAAWRSGATHAGLQALPRDPRNVVQENLEHAFLALSQQAEHAEPSAAELPALLSGGMRFMDDDLPLRMKQSAALRQRTMTAVASDAVSGDTVYADDLVRGLRIDVRTAETGQWRSLCQRRTRYAATGWTWPATNERIADEGVVEPTTYVDRNAAVSSLRLPPELFAWDGWSLVVGHPDSGVDEASEVSPTTRSRIDIETEVPAGSLQPQRFGQRYEFRARTVDLAGNSLSVDDATTLGGDLSPALRASPAVPCLRTESAQPPVVFPAEPPGAGEAGDAIVVRDAELTRYRTPRRRLHVLPAEVSLRTAERHGVFDDMAPEESWSLIQAHQGALGIDANGNTRDHIADKTLIVPYLPDPLGKAAVLILPSGDDVSLPRFDALSRKTSPHTLAQACSLIIEAGDSTVDATTKGRAVTVRVPRGRVTTLKLAASPDATGLTTSALANPAWTGGHDVDGVATAVRTGAAPTIAPHRSIDIVHATQRPLLAPEFVAPEIQARDRNASGAVLIDAQCQFDNPSTGRIDVVAEWTEWRDDLSAPGWRQTQNTVAAGGTRIDPDGPTPFAVNAERRPALAHDFGDTRHRRVTYRPVATSRFIDYYPASLTDDPSNMQLAGAPVTLSIDSTAPPAAPEVAYLIPTLARTEQRSHGNVRSSTERGFGLRVYLQRGWFSSGDGERLAVVFTTNDADAPTSVWGVDPIRRAAALPGVLNATHFAADAERVDAVAIGDKTVDLVVHDVAFSDEHRRPFADIVFESQPSAWPMVRLALARYQANAIDDCHLSPTVLTDFVPLSPDRYATVSPMDLDRWSVALTGQGDTGADGRVGKLVATLEEQPWRVRADDAAWRPVSEPIEFAGTISADFESVWTGEISGPRRRRPSQWRRRLVLREYAAADVAGGKLVAVHTVDLSRR